MNRSCLAAALVLAAVGAAACGTRAPRHVDLPAPAVVTVSGESVSTNGSGAFGKDIPFAPNLTVTLADPHLGEVDPRKGRSLEVQLTAANTITGDAATVPLVGIVCAGNRTPGGFRADTDMLPTSPLPPQTVRSGTLTLYLPGPGCRAPAYVRVQADTEARDIPIPPALLTSLTAPR